MHRIPHLASAPRLSRLLLGVGVLLAGCDGALVMTAPDAGTGEGVDGGLAAIDGGFEAADGGLALDAAQPELTDAGTDAAVEDAGPAFCPRVKVTVDEGLVLNIRPTASTSMPRVGSLPRGYVVEVVDLVHGEAVGAEDRWYQITSPRGDGYVHYDLVACTDDAVTTTPVGFFAPFACGYRVRVTQGPGGGLSHGGTSRYAYDFGCGLNTPIRAMMAGTVSRVWMNTRPGDPCYNGGGSSCNYATNHIMIRHPNGRTSLYKHLNDATVRVGDDVEQGQVIGHSGQTGWATGPHLHAAVCNGATTDPFCQTIDPNFVDIGRPATGSTITSGNCP